MKTDKQEYQEVCCSNIQIIRLRLLFNGKKVQVPADQIPQLGNSVTLEKILTIMHMRGEEGLRGSGERRGAQRGELITKDLSFVLLDLTKIVKFNF